MVYIVDIQNAIMECYDRINKLKSQLKEIPANTTNPDLDMRPVWESTIAELNEIAEYLIDAMNTYWERYDHQNPDVEAKIAEYVARILQRDADGGNDG